MLRPLVVLVRDCAMNCGGLFARVQASEDVLAVRLARDVQEAHELAREEGLDVIVAPAEATVSADANSAREKPLPERADFALTSAALLDAFGDLRWDVAMSDGLGVFCEADAVALARELVIRRSLREEQRVARRSEAARAVAASLAEACTPDDVTHELLAGVLALGARSAALFAVQDEDFVLTEARGYDEAAERVLESVRTEAEVEPLREAVRRGSAVWSRDAVDGPLAIRSAIPLQTREALLAVLAIDFAERAFESDEERRLLEQLVDVGARALARAERFAALQRLVAEERLLLGIASHDLRTPLHVITAASELLGRTCELPERGRTLLSHVVEAAQRSRQLVGQLLELSRIDLSEHHAESANEDLFALVRSAVEDLHVRAPECEVELDLRGSGWVATDRARVQQILQNLLTNAAHYREPGTAIRVRGEGFEQRVYLEVTNRGPAIDEERLAELFAPMRRGTPSGERGSLGLGLYIVERLAHEIGARVWARSSVEAGTTFYLELARRAEQRANIQPEVRGATAPRREPSAPPREYEELLRELEGTPQRRLLMQWLALRGDERLPHPRQLEIRKVLASLPDMFRVLVQPPEYGPDARFSYEYVGAALEQRLRGRGLRGGHAVARDDPMQIGLHAAYERCAQTRRPQYDYVRTGPSARRRECFRRLLLPFSRDGVSVTHLIGLVTFSDLQAASGDEREPPLIRRDPP